MEAVIYSLDQLIIIFLTYLLHFLFDNLYFSLILYNFLFFLKSTNRIFSLEYQPLLDFNYFMISLSIYHQMDFLKVFYLLIFNQEVNLMIKDQMQDHLFEYLFFFSCFQTLVSNDNFFLLALFIDSREIFTDLCSINLCSIKLNICFFHFKLNF